MPTAISAISLSTPYWFASFQGDVVGPLTPTQLHILVERGWIDAQTPVKHDRMKRYVPAGEVVGLMPNAQPAPPPRPRPAWRGTSTDRSTQRHLPLLVIAILGWACALLAILVRLA